jgi:hypothetical protein
LRYPPRHMFCLHPGALYLYTIRHYTNHLKVVPLVEPPYTCILRVERRDKPDILCTILKTMFFLLTVTADPNGLGCSHFRCLLVYSEALASNCTIWGVKSNATVLLERYDGTYIVNGDGRCLVPNTEGKRSWIFIFQVLHLFVQ